MTTQQLPLGLELKPTIASREGKQYVMQCSWCGTLVCVCQTPTRPAPRTLGPCPACGNQTWWEQLVPADGLGMFRLATELEAQHELTSSELEHANDRIGELEGEA